MIVLKFRCKKRLKYIPLKVFNNRVIAFERFLDPAELNVDVVFSFLYVDDDSCVRYQIRRRVVNECVRYVFVSYDYRNHLFGSCKVSSERRYLFFVSELKNLISSWSLDDTVKPVRSYVFCLDADLSSSLDSIDHDQFNGFIAFLGKYF